MMNKEDLTELKELGWLTYPFSNMDTEKLWKQYLEDKYIADHKEDYGG